MSHFSSARARVVFVAAGVALVAAPVVAAPFSFVVGTDAGPTGTLRTFNSAGEVVSTFTPYAGFAGGVRVAVGDINNDGTPDIITGAGPGAPGGHVKVFSGQTGAEISSFLPFSTGFSGGVRVASGDVNGDGVADIVVGAGSGAVGGHVKVFDGVTGSEIRSFLAFDGFTGGVTVASGDVNGDGHADIITGGASGSFGGHVKVFDGATGGLLQSFFAYNGATSIGVEVAAGDLTGDGLADIITGASAGAAGGHVKVFNGHTGLEAASFLAFSGFTGGVRVAVGDINGDGSSDIGAGLDGGTIAQARFFTGTGEAAGSMLPFGPSFTGGIFVAAVAVPAPGTVTAALGLGATMGLVRRRR